MARFMVVYRSQVSAQEQMANADPAQAQAGMDAWTTTRSCRPTHPTPS